MCIIYIFLLIYKYIHMNIDLLIEVYTNYKSLYYLHTLYIKKYKFTYIYIYIYIRLYIFYYMKYKYDIYNILI